MDNNIFLELNNILEEKNAKYFLVNSTNEFLQEYNSLNRNSRYLLTKFSGSTGEAIYSYNKVDLYVDSRYHEMAQKEVDQKYVNVIKLCLGQTFFQALEKKVNKYDKIIVVGQKISQNTYEQLNSIFNYIEILNYDPIIEINKISYEKSDIYLKQIPQNVSGLSCAKKIEKLQKKLKKNDLFLISNLEDIAYFTNLRKFDVNKFQSTFEAKLLISKNNAILFTDELISNNKYYFDIMKVDEFQRFINENYVNQDKYYLYINKNFINALDYKYLNENFIIKNDNFSHLYKTVKNMYELKHIKNCYKRTDYVIEKIRKIIENFIGTEYDLCELLKKEFIQSVGAKCLSFKPIIAFGKNSSIIHYTSPSKSKYLKDNDFILIDTGAYFEGGYATDITRTFIKGVASEEQKKVYTTVLKGFLNAYNKKGKITGYNLDFCAREIIDSIKPKKYNFAHALGHGVGINVHEGPPYISMSNFAKKRLLKNMVFTIEPGLYRENIGGVRLENTCYTYKKNNRLRIKTLSKVKFERKLIDFKMLSKKEKKQLKQWI